MTVYISFSLFVCLYFLSNYLLGKPQQASHSVASHLVLSTIHTKYNKNQETCTSFKNLLPYITTHPYTVYVIHPCHDKWTSYITVLPYVVCVIIHAMVINSPLSYVYRSALLHSSQACSTMLLASV